MLASWAAPPDLLAPGAQRVAEVFGVPLGTAIVRTGDDSCLWTHAGAATWTQSEAPGPMPGASPLGAVLSGGQALVLADVSRDALFASQLEPQYDGLRFFAGAPLTLPDAGVIGALSIHDVGARTLAAEDLHLLRRMAADLAAAVAAQGGVAACACAPRPQGSSQTTLATDVAA